MLPADVIRDLPQPDVIADVVFILPSGLERDGIDDEVVVQRVRVEVRRDDDLILIAPHLSCGSEADPVALLRRDLAGTEALVAVVGDVAAVFSEAFLGGGHVLIGGLRIAVDRGDKELLVRLGIVLHVLECVGQVPVEELPVRGLVRVVGILDDGLQ